MAQERIIQVVDLAYECLRTKVNGGRIKVDNEASLQLHFGSILKTVGELFETSKDEHFSIELEKSIFLEKKTFGKSRSNRAKIDIFCEFSNTISGVNETCAIELKFFKKANQREPNNRYDAFLDIANLEQYESIAKHCFLIVATDHDHYVNKGSYSEDTADFDFRHGSKYELGKIATYRTKKPHGNPIILRQSYLFHWDSVAGGYHFMKLSVQPIKE